MAISLIIPIAGAFLVFIASPYGPGLTNDSTRYLRIANVLRGDHELGKGYPEFMRHFPPGYPALLAAGKFINLSNQTTGRWLNVVAMALTAFVVTRTVQRLCNVELWPGLVAAAIVVTSHVSLMMHLHVWSEPTFQVFLLVTLALLVRQVEAPTPRHAILIALVVAASTMIRYAGASLIIMGAITLLFVQRTSWKNRLIDCVIFCLIAATPLLSLAAYNRHRAGGGEAIDRQLAHYGLHQVQFREAWTTMATWIFPEHKVPPKRRNWAFLVVVVSFCAVVASRMSIRKRARETGEYIRPPLPAYVRLALLMCVVYLGFLFVSLAFVDPATPLDDRILSPIYLLAIIVGMYGVHRALTLTGAMTAPMAGKIATVVMLIAFVVSTAIRGYDIWQFSKREGFGYVNVRWRESELMKVIKAIPPNTLVYTNVPDAVYFYTTNQSRLIPKSNQKLSAKQMKEMKYNLKNTQHRIRKEGAVIALFYGTADTRFRRGTQSPAEIEKVLNARRVLKAKDGVLLIPVNATPKVKKIVARARRHVFPKPETTFPATASTTKPSRASS